MTATVRISTVRTRSSISIRESWRNDIYARDLRDDMVSPHDADYEELIAYIFSTMRTATEMNTGWHTPEEWREPENAVATIPVVGNRYNAEQQRQV